jgi:hypothetical protein
MDYMAIQTLATKTQKLNQYGASKREHEVAKGKEKRIGDRYIEQLSAKDLRRCSSRRGRAGRNQPTLLRSHTGSCRRRKQKYTGCRRRLLCRADRSSLTFSLALVLLSPLPIISLSLPLPCSAQEPRLAPRAKIRHPNNSSSLLGCEKVVKWIENKRKVKGEIKSDTDRDRKMGSGGEETTQTHKHIHICTGLSNIVSDSAYKTRVPHCALVCGATLLVRFVQTVARNSVF